MKFNKFKLLICLTLVIVFIVSYSTTAFAAPHLEWCTTAVYYDDGQLVIKGYFNNNGSTTIDRINSIRLQVYFQRNGSNWWLASIGNWYDLDVYLDPGDSHYFNLRITNPNYYNFDTWRVVGNFNYHNVN